MLSLVDCARNMVPMGSARSATAQQVPNHPKKGSARSTAVATQKCARSKAASLLLQLVVFAINMVRLKSARLMTAPPTHKVVDLHIALNTAVELEAVLRVGLHHHLTTQGSLSETRRWSRSMLHYRLPKPDGQHQDHDLPFARWERLLFTRRMLDACYQERWKLLQAYREVKLDTP